MVIVQRNLLRLGPDANPHALAWRLRFADLVSRDGDRFRLPLNIDTDTAVLSDSENPVLLDQVAISLERRLGLFSEQDADLAARPDVVVADNVVRIAMPDGDAKAFVPFDNVFLGQAPADAPAEEKTQICYRSDDSRG